MSNSMGNSMDELTHKMLKKIGFFNIVGTMEDYAIVLIILYGASAGLLIFGIGLCLYERSAIQRAIRARRINVGASISSAATSYSFSASNSANSVNLSNPPSCVESVDILVASMEIAPNESQKIENELP